MTDTDFAKTIIGATCIQNFMKKVNKRRKEYLTGSVEHNILTKPTDPYQKLTFHWHPIAKRFSIQQGTKLWGLIDVQGNIMTSPGNVVANIKNEDVDYLTEKGTLSKK